MSRLPDDERAERALRIEGGLILAAMIFVALLWIADKLRG